MSDLLDVTRLTSGDFEISREAVDLVELTRHAIEDCEPTLRRNRTAIVLEAPTFDRAITVAGDPVRLLQALTNVIDNAARFSPEGSVRVEVLVVENDAIVRITDNGSGISPEQIEQLFEVVTVARVKADGSGGLGLGLALARRIVELHRGQLTAASEGLGKGATFEIRLPVSPEEVE